MCVHTIFHDGYRKSDHDFLIVIHSNFSAVMHGFRDNKILLQTGYDVIVTSLVLCYSGRFAVFVDGI